MQDELLAAEQNQTGKQSQKKGKAQGTQPQGVTQLEEAKKTADTRIPNQPINPSRLSPTPAEKQGIVAQTREVKREETRMQPTSSGQKPWPPENQDNNNASQSSGSSLPPAVPTQTTQSQIKQATSNQPPQQRVQTHTPAQVQQPVAQSQNQQLHNPVQPIDLTISSGQSLQQQKPGRSWVGVVKTPLPSSAEQVNQATSNQGQPAAQLPKQPLNNSVQPTQSTHSSGQSPQPQPKPIKRLAEKEAREKAEQEAQERAKQEVRERVEEEAQEATLDGNDSQPTQLLSSGVSEQQSYVSNEFQTPLSHLAPPYHPTFIPFDRTPQPPFFSPYYPVDYYFPYGEQAAYGSSQLPYQPSYGQQFYEQAPPPNGYAQPPFGNYQPDAYYEGLQAQLRLHEQLNQANQSRIEDLMRRNEKLEKKNKKLKQEIKEKSRRKSDPCMVSQL